MKYRLLTGKHGRFEDGESVVYRKDDEIDLTPGEAKSLGKRVEPIAGAKAEPNGAPVNVFGLSSLDVAKAAAKVMKLDAVELDIAEAEEKAGKDRKGVHEAIEARRAGLEG